MLIKGNSGALASVVSGNSGGASAPAAVAVVNGGGGGKTYGVDVGVACMDAATLEPMSAEFFAAPDDVDITAAGVYCVTLPLSASDASARMFHVHAGSWVALGDDVGYASVSVSIDSGAAQQLTAREIVGGYRIWPFTIPASGLSDYPVAQFAVTVS